MFQPLIELLFEPHDSGLELPFQFLEMVFVAGLFEFLAFGTDPFGERGEVAEHLLVLLDVPGGADQLVVLPEEAQHFGCGLVAVGGIGAVGLGVTVLAAAADHHLELLESKQLLLAGGLPLEVVLWLILVVVVAGAVRVVRRFSLLARLLLLRRCPLTIQVVFLRLLFL